MAVVRGFSIVCLVVGSVVFIGGFVGRWPGGGFSGFGLIFAELVCFDFVVDFLGCAKLILWLLDFVNSC